jgi:DNA-directed RNA polymerase subunit RPC12/RpoP
MLPSQITVKKPLVEHCDRLNIRAVKEAIPHNAMEVTLEIGDQIVHVVGRLTNLRNGYRYFFVCSRCGRPYENLYRQDFSEYQCRQCMGLIYASSAKISLKGM